MKVRVKFLQDHGDIACKGEVFNMEENTAESMQQDGIVEILQEEIKQEVEDELRKIKYEEKHISKQEEDLKQQLRKLIKVKFPLKPDYDNATELLTEEFKKRYRVYATREAVNPEFWIYLDGIYVSNGATYVDEFCRENLGNLYKSTIKMRVLDKIKADSYLEPEKFFANDNPHEVCVSNGILNIYTKELIGFTPEKRFFNKMPVVYNPEAKCVLIDKHFENVLSNPQDKVVLYELVGYCLEQSHFIEKAFMFVGNGRNGKGKTLELIKRLVGVESCCSVALSAMQETSFNLHQMFGKKVNLAGDLSSTDLKHTGLFKSLTGRDLITAKRKYLSDLIFISTCKNVFACNELPKVYDLSQGFWSRWVLLEFPYEFVKKEVYEALPESDRKFKKIMDNEHINKITSPEELSGLLNMALEGLNRLIENKDFSYSVGTSTIKDMWVRKSNSFTAFCIDCIEEDDVEYISKEVLRKAFNNYRKTFKVKGAGDREIKATLEDMFGVSESRVNINQEFVNVWKGIKLKEKGGKK